MRVIRWVGFLLAVSCLGQTLELGDVVFLGSDAYPETVAVDIGPGGIRLLAGSATEAGLPMVQGSGDVWVPVICSTIGQPTPCRDGYAAVFEPSGEIRFATYVGGARDDRVIDAAFASDGDVWLLTTSSSAEYPVDTDFSNGAPRAIDTFLTRLNGDTGVIVSSTRLPAGLRGAAFDIGPDGSLFVAGEAPPGLEEVSGLDLDLGAVNYFRSDDGGATWRTANRGLGVIPSDTQAWPDGQGGTVLTGSKSNSFYVSRDRGESWKRIDTPDQRSVESVAVVSGDPVRLLVALSLGVFSLDLETEIWQEVFGGRVEWLAAAPSDPSVVYAWGDSGVHRSSDGGVSFEATQWTTASSRFSSGGITVDPADADTVYLSSIDYQAPHPLLISSVDGGASWVEMPLDIPEHPRVPGPFGWPLSVKFGPGPAPAMYVALNGGLFRSRDGGTTWEIIDLGIRDQALRSADDTLIVTRVHVNGTTIHAVTFAGMFRSHDDGETWERFGTSLPLDPRDSTLEFDPIAPDTAYVVGLEGAENVFVLKTDPNATTIEYLAVLGGAGSDIVKELNVDSLGRAWVTGHTAAIDFPVTNEVPGPAYAGGVSDAFVAALSPTGTTLEFATLTGGPGQDRTVGAALDDDGRLWTIRNIWFDVPVVLSSYTLTESTETALDLADWPLGSLSMEVDAEGRIWALADQFCDPRFCPPRESYLGVFDGDGEPLATTMLNEAVALALDSNGDAWIGGQGELGVAPLVPPLRPRGVGYLAKLSLGEPADGPRLSAVVQAAGFSGGPLVAGSIVSLFGEELGPVEGTSFKILDGFVESAPGTRVFFDEEEAAVLFAQSGQVNAIIPSAVAGRSSAKARVETATGTSISLRLATAEACPAIFQVAESGQAAALNQDGSVNSMSNPAPRGSVVAVFVTGLGGYQPAVEPEQVAPLEPPFPRAARPIQAFWDDDPVAITYAGVAPGLIAAASQMNVPIPPNTMTGARKTRLEAAGCSGSSGIVWVR